MLKLIVVHCSRLVSNCSQTLTMDIKKSVLLLLKEIGLYQCASFIDLIPKFDLIISVTELTSHICVSETELNSFYGCYSISSLLDSKPRL